MQRAQKPWDRVFLLLIIFGFLGWMALMGWDATRTGFTAVLPWLQALGGLGVISPQSSRAHLPNNPEI